MRSRPTVLLATKMVGVGSPGSVMVMLVRTTLPPTLLTITPSQLGVTPSTTRSPPIVLVLIVQGLTSSPPPISVTFPLTVIPFSRTVSASMAVTFPKTVMVDFWCR